MSIGHAQITMTNSGEWLIKIASRNQVRSYNINAMQRYDSTAIHNQRIFTTAIVVVAKRRRQPFSLGNGHMRRLISLELSPSRDFQTKGLLKPQGHD